MNTTIERSHRATPGEVSRQLRLLVPLGAAAVLGLVAGANVAKDAIFGSDNERAASSSVPAVKVVQAPKATVIPGVNFKTPEGFGEGRQIDVPVEPNDGPDSLAKRYVDPKEYTQDHAYYENLQAFIAGQHDGLHPDGQEVHLPESIIKPDVLAELDPAATH